MKSNPSRLATPRWSRAHAHLLTRSHLVLCLAFSCAGCGTTPSDPVPGADVGGSGPADVGGSSSSGGVVGAGGATSSSGGDAQTGSTGGRPSASSGGFSGGNGGSSTAGGGAAASGGTNAQGTGGAVDTGGSPSGGAGTGGQVGPNGPGPELTTISWGTTLQPPDVVMEARALAEAEVDESSPTYRAKGDQKRTYSFASAGRMMPYRLSVPMQWDGQSELPLVMFLHGSGANENTYVDQNGKQMVTLAEEHEFILVSPLGGDGAYGSYLRLPAVFGEPEAAETQIAAKTAETERTQEVSERDVIQVLEIVLREYPVDPKRVFLMGHSMGSGGTWYIGGKYSFYFRAIAPMSGPFVQEAVYPWARLMSVPMLVTEGTDTPSLGGSRALRDWLMRQGYPYEYLEVAADHGGMVLQVLPSIFDFFDRIPSNG
jgi:poly(3-hydroxybutyrate) depolymerase